MHIRSIPEINAQTSLKYKDFLTHTRTSDDINDISVFDFLDTHVFLSGTFLTSCVLIGRTLSILGGAASPFTNMMGVSCKDSKFSPFTDVIGVSSTVSDGSDGMNDPPSGETREDIFSSH